MIALSAGALSLLEQDLQLARGVLLALQSPRAAGDASAVGSAGETR